MNAAVTFIIPVYNVRGYVKRCFESVVDAVSQWRLEPDNVESDCEIICVDDGSSDGSGEVLDELASLTNRQRHGVSARIIHQNNAGVSVARNVALDIATGDFVFFVDSDDCLTPGFLSQAISAMKDDPELDIWIGQRTDVDNDYNILPPERQMPRIAGMTTSNPIKDFLLVDGRYWLYGAAGKLFRHSFIQKGHLRFRQGMNIGEDALFMSMAYALARKVQVDGSLVCYIRCQRNGSLIRRPWAELIPQYFESSRLLEEFAADNHFESKMAPLIAQGALSRIKAVFSRGYSYEWMSRYVDALCGHEDFMERVPRVIVKYSKQPYRMFGLALYILPATVIRILLKVAIRFTCK